MKYPNVSVSSASRAAALIILALCVPGPRVTSAQPTVAHPEGRQTALPTYPTVGGVAAPLRALVLAADAELYADPSQPKEVVGTAGKYLSRDYNILDFYPRAANPPAYCLLAASRDGAIREFGWIACQHVIWYADVKRPNIVALRDPRTKVHRKCMLIRRLGKGNEQSQGTGQSKAKIGFYDRPDERGRLLQERSLFEIYYIYWETDTFFFAGQEPKIDVTTLGLKSMAGWVSSDKDTVVRWNTREALEFNKRDWESRSPHAPALVFKTRQALDDYLKSDERAGLEELKSKQPSVLWGWEDLAKHECMRSDMPRYPVLSSREWPENGRNHVYEIGIVGDVYDKGSDLRPTMSGAELAGMQREAARMVDEASVLQIMFVIKRTASMETWRGELRNIIRDINRKVTQQTGMESYAARSVEISLNFYRSHADLGGLKFNKFQEREIDAREVLNQIQFEGGGFKSCMFSAIIGALDNARLKADRTKLIIVLADAGNAGNTGNAIATHNDTLTEEDVAAKIIEAGGEHPPMFIAFFVGNDDTARRLFETQTAKIGRLLVKHKIEREAKTAEQKGEGSLKQSVRDWIAEQYSKRVSTSSVDEVASTVKEGLSNKLIELNAHVERIREKMAGEGRQRKPTQSSDPAGFVWDQEIFRDFKARGYDIEKLQGAYQMFVEGWVLERHPAQTMPRGWSEPPACVRHMVLMHRYEVDQLSRGIDLLLSYRVPDETKAWLESFKRLFPGEDVNEQTDLSVILQNQLAIQAKTGILATSYADIWKMKPADRDKLFHQLDCIKLQLADAIHDGICNIYEEDKESAKGVQVPEWKPARTERDGIWCSPDPSTSEANKKAWLPREYLP